MPTHTQLKGVTDIGSSLLSDQLEANIINFFQWGTLNIGGFFDVTIPTTGFYGGNQHRLRLVNDQGYSSGQVWEGFRKDWVWETDLEYSRQPINISGVFVNGNFQPGTGVGPYAHTIDYPNGRVVFQNAIPANSVVTCEYSYRLYNWTNADAPWWREFQEQSFRVDDAHFQQQGSGAWNVLSENRIQLPAVIVESVMRTDRKPKSIGSMAQVVSQDVLFHVVGERKRDVKRMHDIITNQQEKRIRGFDINLMYEADAYPLNDDGSRKDDALMYPDIVRDVDDGGFAWEQIRFTKMVSVQQPSKPPLFYTTVRGTFEVDLP